MAERGGLLEEQIQSILMSSDDSSLGTLLVAAIDFGTTYTGIAWQYREDYRNTPLLISAKKWSSANQSGFVSEKTPTALLLGSNRDFVAFGSEAEDEYAAIADDNAQAGHRFFRNFKMMLYNEKNLTRESTITDDQGHPMKAKDVFAHSIRYLIKQLMKEVEKAGSLVQEDEVFWVLTVPAIWDEAARQFMKEAANEAGIPNKRLTLALEPEAAAIYAKESLTQRVEGHLETYSPGTRYIVIDLGGGTVDITVRKVLNDKSLEDLHKASGNDWGGLKVNERFLSFLKELIGSDVIDEVQTQRAVFLDLEREIELKKRTPNKDGRIVLQFPSEIAEAYKEKRRKPLTNNVAFETRYAGKIDIKRGKVHIDKSIVQEFFQPSINQIIKHTKQILSDEKTSGVSEMILVGGFSECSFVSESIQKAFSNIRVLVPSERSLAVLKGAVLFGQNPTAVNSRICPATYGISVSRYFLEGHDDPSKRQIKDGTPYCTDLFHPLATMGQSFKVGELVTTEEVFPLTADMTKMSVRLYKATTTDPKYVTDDECSFLGKMVVDMPDTAKGRERKVEVSLMFGDVQIKCRGKDMTSKKAVEIYLDLLSSQN